MKVLGFNETFMLWCLSFDWLGLMSEKRAYLVLILFSISTLCFVFRSSLLVGAISGKGFVGGLLLGVLGLFWFLPFVFGVVRLESQSQLKNLDLPYASRCPLSGTEMRD